MSEKTVYDMLKKDHDQFTLNFGNGLKNLGVTKNLKIAHLLWAYCDLFLETYHHEVEETCLFKKAAQNPQIINGGPFCTHFYDIQMQNNPIIRVYQELNIKGSTIRQEHIPEGFTEEFEKKLPIVIPLEEHIAGKILLKEIHSLIGKDGDIHRIIKLFNLYNDIQIFHFKKEESCFFEMSSNLLSSEDIIDAKTYTETKKLKVDAEVSRLVVALSLKI